MEMLDLGRYITALLFVLGLVWAVLIVARKILAGHGGIAGPGKRLKVIESLMIDNRTRLVMIKRDDHAHLLMIGQNHSSVIERDIPLEAEATQGREKGEHTLPHGARL